MSKILYIADIIPNEYSLFQAIASAASPLPAHYIDWSAHRGQKISQHRNEGLDVREVAIRFDDFHNHHVLLRTLQIGERDIDDFAEAQATQPIRK